MTILPNRVMMHCWATKSDPLVILTFNTLLLLTQATYATVSPITLNIITDRYGSETTWEITDSSGTPMAEGGPYVDGNTTPIAETIDLPIGTGYTFTIYDSYGDGICCNYSNGAYSLKDATGTVIASGGEFADEKSTQFDINISPSELVITGNSPTTIPINKVYSFTPTVSGNNGSPLTYSIKNKPVWATFDSNTGKLTGTPSGDYLDTTNQNIEISVFKSNDHTKTATLVPFDLTVVLGNTLDFDGIDDYVTIPNASSLIADSQEITISGWVYPRDNPEQWQDYGGFFGFRNNSDANFYMIQLANQEIEGRFTNSENKVFSVKAEGLILKKWQHLALVYDGTTSSLKLYLNGKEKASTSASGTIKNSQVPFEIGRTKYSTYFNFDGKIDEVALWNKALSSTDIESNRLRRLQENEPGLVAYYPFDECMGTTTDDKTTTNNSGTLQNGPEWVDCSLMIVGTPATTAKVDKQYSFTPTVIGNYGGGSLTFQIENKPAWADFYTNTGHLAGTPTSEYVNSMVTGIVISVDNGNITESLTPFDLKVILSTEPTITGTPPTEVVVNSEYRFTPIVEDGDGDSLSFTIENQPSWASFDSNTGTLAGTPNNRSTATTTSTLSIFYCRVKFLEFDSGIFGRESPIHFSPMSITTINPCGHFTMKGFLVWNATVQALARKNA